MQCGGINFDKLKPSFFFLDWKKILLYITFGLDQQIKEQIAEVSMKLNHRETDMTKLVEDL